jgi:hypothetical protein
MKREVRLPGGSGMRFRYWGGRGGLNVRRCRLWGRRSGMALLSRLLLSRCFGEGLTLRSSESQVILVCCVLHSLDDTWKK